MQLSRLWLVSSFNTFLSLVNYEKTMIHDPWQWVKGAENSCGRTIGSKEMQWVVSCFFLCNLQRNFSTLDVSLAPVSAEFKCINKEMKFPVIDF